MNIAADSIDLAAYFKRIGYNGTKQNSMETLQKLHFLHPLAIPFENLDPLLGHPVNLDLASLQAKLIHAKRGGFCYEQNLLFMQVLTMLGFKVRGLAARVMWGRPVGAILGRTHMLLLIDLPDGPWIVDVGFGGITLTAPLQLREEVEQQTPHEIYRFDRLSDTWVLSVKIDAEWRPVYKFGLEEQTLLDFEICNYYVSTNQNSQFVHRLMAARPTSDGRYTLLNNRLSFHSATTEKKKFSSAAEIEQVLRDIFGIDVPPGLEEAVAQENLLV